MKLEELLPFESIVIQCHDDPDADAVASGWGILLYLQAHGKNARLIYGGSQPLHKSNIVLMVRRLRIPIEHIQTLDAEPDLLLMVDCQYGERNVQQFTGKTVAVIDHHKAKAAKIRSALWEVRDNYGSCSTVVWDLLCQAGVAVSQNEALSTALYYGLFMDTSRLQELRHPKDKDLRDQLEFACSKSCLFEFQNCNLSLEELNIVAHTLSHYEYDPDGRFAVVEAERCDPNILGLISDMLIEVDVVDICVVYCMLSGGAKLSVRSCVRQTMADELAVWLTRDVGSGGGHIHKAGGFMPVSLLLPVVRRVCGLLNETELGADVGRLLFQRLRDYLHDQDIIDISSGQIPDLSGEAVYQKRRLPIGYVHLTDLYPVGTKLTLRMLEGDLPVTVLEDTYLVIGVESEVYKNDRDYLLAHNDLSDQPYVFRGEYAPTVRQAVQAMGLEAQDIQPKSLTDYAKTAVPRKGSCIHARQIAHRTKVFVSWSERYMLGMPGDWLAARVESPSDIYMICLRKPMTVCPESSARKADSECCPLFRMMRERRGKMVCQAVSPLVPFIITAQRRKVNRFHKTFTIYLQSALFSSVLFINCSKNSRTGYVFAASSLSCSSVMR